NQAIGQMDEVTQQNAALVEQSAAAAAAMQEQAHAMAGLVGVFKLDQAHAQTGATAAAGRSGRGRAVALAPATRRRSLQG
ncbi:MAG: methyl-accepting chemotaxis protein, partial [Pseudomonadota bacterium]